jgi:hypothetical protein
MIVARPKMPEGAAKETVIHVRIAPRNAALLQLIADSETGGNRSELVRQLVERKVEERLSGHSPRGGRELAGATT